MAGGGFNIGAILEDKRSDEDDYFKILGCSESSMDEQINTEYKIRALQFQRLYRKPGKHSELCMSYNQWLGMSNRCATTMHWAKPNERTMLESFSDHRTKVDVGYSSTGGSSN